MISTSLAEAAAALLGSALSRAERLHGGDLSEVVRLILRDGRVAIAKGGPAPRTEAAMLAAIRDSGIPAPAVLAVSDDVLVLEEQSHDGRLGDAWADLGHCLFRLHRHAGQRYGWDADYAFGTLAISNRWHDHWPTFWAECRLLPHLPHLPPTLARRVESLATDLPNRLPARPVASLLHGDLWSGNVLVANGQVAGLIDPACYYGNAEVDLAMLGLFDHPPGAFQAAYGALAPGYEERLEIYRLWPALVHLRLFGAGYRGLVEGILDGLRV